MKKIKFFFLTTTVFFGPFLLAAQPPDIGHFKGLAFSSATDRHPLEIHGGSLVRCVTDPAARLETNKCEVEQGSLIVGGSEWNSLNVKFSRASIMHFNGTSPSRVYYLRGTVDLKVGEKQITTVAGVTLTVEDAAPDKVRGFIDLPEQAARTSLEAYLVP